MALKCDICAKSFSGIESYQQHNASEKHKKKIRLSQMVFPSSSVSQGDESFEQEDSTSLQASNASVSEPQLMQCTVCSIGFTCFANFQKHVNGMEHAKMVQNKNASATDSPYPVPKENNADNIVVEKYFNPNPVSAFPILPPPHAECELCQKQFSGPEPYQQHLVSAGHKRKLDLQSLQKDGIENKSETEKVINDQQPLGYNESIHGATWLVPRPFAECTLCQKQFSGPEPYQQHMVSAGHKKKVIQNQWQNSYQDGNQHQVEGTIADEQEMLESTKAVGSNFQTVIPPPYAECEVCQKQFSGLEPYQQHLVSAAHKKKTTIQQFSVNSGESREDDCILRKCSICDMSFQGLSQYTEHLDSSFHRRKEDFIKSTINVSSNDSTTSNKDGFHADLSFNTDWYCKICKKQCSGPMPYNQHIISQAHQKKLRVEEIEANLSRIRNAQLSEEQENSPINTIDPSKINNTDELNQLFKESDMNNLNSNLNPFNDDDKTNNFSKGFNIDSNDLIFGDALKHLNVISPEDLNITIIRADEEVKFDDPMKVTTEDLEKFHLVEVK